MKVSNSGGTCPGCEEPEDSRQHNRALLLELVHTIGLEA